MGAQSAHTKSSKKHSERIFSVLPLFLSKSHTFDVPIYPAWVACKRVRLLKKFPSAEYHVNNLYIVNDSRVFEVGGLDLHLLGLIRAEVKHSLMNNSEERTAILISNPYSRSNPLAKYRPRNMIGQAQSGTEKAAAFVLTLFSGIDYATVAVQATCLIPARESARQIVEVAKEILARSLPCV